MEKSVKRGGQSSLWWFRKIRFFVSLFLICTALVGSFFIFANASTINLLKKSAHIKLDQRAIPTTIFSPKQRDSTDITLQPRTLTTTQGITPTPTLSPTATLTPQGTSTPSSTTPATGDPTQSPAPGPGPAPVVAPAPVAPVAPLPPVTLTGGPIDGYGLYDSCIIDQPGCQQDLQVMGNAGFRLILNYNQMNASAANELIYAQMAAAHGIKIIWAFNDMSSWYGANTDIRSRYPDFSATCNCKDNNGFVQYVVNLVKNLPATWGYYIADEVPPSEHAHVKSFSDLVHQLDPNHPRLLVLGSDGPYVNDGLNTYADTAEVIAQDYYPVGDPYEGINDTGTVAKQVQAVADKYGKQSGMVLQAHSLGEYTSYQNYCSPFPACLPYPTMDQMKSMRDQTLGSSHPRMVLWYSYFDLVGSNNYGQHWNSLATAVRS